MTPGQLCHKWSGKLIINWTSFSAGWLERFGDSARLFWRSSVHNSPPLFNDRLSQVCERCSAAASQHVGLLHIALNRNSEIPNRK